MADAPIACRACGARLPAGGSARNPFFPFCSAACRYRDLGKWIAGEFRVPGEPVRDTPEPADPDPD